MLSVVVPVYNELDGVAELVRATRRRASRRRARTRSSSSTTARPTRPGTRLAVLAAGDPHVRLIRLSRNFGHQAALSAGLHAAHGEAVVLIDGDLQDPPEVIPAARREVARGLRRRLRGSRLARGRDPSGARRDLAFYRLLRRITTTAIPPNAGDFRLLSRRAARRARAMPERSTVPARDDELGRLPAGRRRRTAREARHAGETKYSLGKMVRLRRRRRSRRSRRRRSRSSPARLLARRVLHRRARWSLVPALHGRRRRRLDVGDRRRAAARRGSALALGIIGQYVARIFEETKQRPLYFVDEIGRARNCCGRTRPPTDAARDGCGLLRR